LRAAYFALVLVHDDGHVRQIGVLPQTMTILGDLGITGWHAEPMEVGEAARRMFAGQRCAACDLTLPCGCLAESAYRGGCPHGGYDLVLAAMLKAART
jgi:hypothetical protein